MLVLQLINCSLFTGAVLQSVGRQNCTNNVAIVLSDQEVSEIAKASPVFPTHVGKAWE
jgi:hypothetical protein